MFLKIKTKNMLKAKSNHKLFLRERKGQANV